MATPSYCLAARQRIREHVSQGLSWSPELSGGKNHNLFPFSYVYYSFAVLSFDFKLSYPAHLLPIQFTA
jgi:hypothetical protein